MLANISSGCSVRCQRTDIEAEPKVILARRRTLPFVVVEWAVISDAATTVKRAKRFLLGHVRVKATRMYTRKAGGEALRAVSVATFKQRAMQIVLLGLQ